MAAAFRAAVAARAEVDVPVPLPDLPPFVGLVEDDGDVMDERSGAREGFRRASRPSLTFIRFWCKASSFALIAFLRLRRDKASGMTICACARRFTGAPLSLIPICNGSDDRFTAALVAELVPARELDFEDFEPGSRLVAEPPYQNEPDLNKIPDNKLHTYYEKGIDSSRVMQLSKLLYDAQEPILNNYFLGQEIYRFTWTRSFHDHYILTLYSISSKKKPEIRITKIDGSTGQIEKSVKRIKKADFDDFKKRLNNSNFWIMKPYEWTIGFDGSTWTIEAHVPLAYKMLCRWRADLLYER